MRRIYGSRPTVKTVTVAAACMLLLAGAAFAYSKQAELTAKRSKRGINTFVIRGSIDHSLSPGVTSQINIEFANHRKKPIWITKLVFSATINRPHSDLGCTLKRDYVLRQLQRKTFPIYVPANKKIKVRQGRVKVESLRWRKLAKRKARGRPAITMVSLRTVNQEACRGATLNLKFHGRATTKRRKARR